mmetsp:Transcript_15931/g.34614  ORF Transcript_15931/g.34614 Transcript_15931/m.34614 type:complete len:474 (+) Transcript_15931:165-1586(+)|eukprot:CAMPEP_0178502620 /NCGR_PEP_ID=MMETSP0696-20121128/17601_1 /TAXON_ID=265572 /ORGANISM="Extubocellulus spinifer, Strain CCMP396" /LENGTH=473 /DNA_ID=CAMNT_0020131689 /DNA_START=112 /DNA_END=1533 /DNA_ORIENTATION=-
MVIMDWCEVCEETSSHAKICEVCGEELVARPASSAASGNGPANSTSPSMSREEAATILTAVEAHRTGAAAWGTTGSTDAASTTAAASGAGDATAPSISAVAQSWAAQDQAVLLEAVRTATGIAAGGAGGDNDGEWQTAPPEAMDPTAATRRDRPTSKECISRIPRIEVGPNSSILHECGVTVLPPVMCGPFGGCGGSSGNALKRRSHAFDSVVAEFGPPPPYETSGRLVLCKPTTGRGGLDATTMASLGANSSYPTVAYMERGDGVTFVRKALMAQAAGASAVLVGNNVGVWPYVMQDSTGEADKRVTVGKRKSDCETGEEENKDDEKDGAQDIALKIPVVMVKRSDGRAIRSILEKSPGCTTRCTIAAKRVGSDSASSSSSSSSDGGCVVCTDQFKVGDTVMRLPFCAHCFHEECAMTWLKKHNTCPMCRRELPTDDDEYESRRRADGRSHASAASSSDGGLAENQWESLFG